MPTILANDGIDPSGLRLFQEAGHTVITDKVPQDALADYLRQHQVAALLVRSATKVTAKELGAWPGLKVVGRGGVGLDNVDQAAARQMGVAVVNTPAASSESVAELAMAHMYALARFLHTSNRHMPSMGATEFERLKKDASKGIELRGRTLGIIGFGRIGQALAALALGNGMKVLAHDPFVQHVKVELHIEGYGTAYVKVDSIPVADLLRQSDIISLHVPKPKDGPVIGALEMALLPKGALVINTARGGVVDEAALLAAMEEGHIGGAGLDVFLDEPHPDERLLNHPRISVTPHIGASTNEAQGRIGIELAQKVMAALA
jgi:D-3-phosphoglycerate dehydrogenase